MMNTARSATADAFARAPLPKRFCNLDRLLHAMKARGLDGIVATAPWNVFYLTAFNGIAHKSDEPRPYAVILSRHMPEHPVLILADYYLATFLKQPTWVEDLRPFRAVMMPLDLPAQHSDIDRFIPQDGAGALWIAHARAAYAFDMASAVRRALKDLRLDHGRVAFDDMGFGFRLEVEGLEVADGYDPLMFARAVKTETELCLLQRATALNEAAIRRTIAAWDKGATWRDLNKAYACAVTELGGFVRDPGGMVWGHPRGTDPALTLVTGLERDVVEPGSHVMFDCHGTIDLYCWDGGKTWVVEGEPEGAAKRFADATARVAQMLLSAMRPGARISELKAKGREIYRRAHPSADRRAFARAAEAAQSHLHVYLARSQGGRRARLPAPRHASRQSGGGGTRCRGVRPPQERVFDTLVAFALLVGFERAGKDIDDLAAGVILLRSQPPMSIVAS
jgi:Xaa-Pro aminopeptidase